LRQEFAASGPLLAAGLTMFGVPIFVFFFLVFALIQVLYLDRLALRAQVFGAEKETLLEDQAGKRL
jgi:hypothetical protein